MGGAVVALAMPGVAAAQAPAIEILYGVAPDGGGTLSASPMPPTEGDVTWSSCAGGGPACVPYPSEPRSRPALNAGDSAPGTVFEAQIAVGGQLVTARSLPYQGRVRWTEPPGIAGRLRANGFVRPIPAKWTGGWGNQRSYPQLQVCTGPRARHCLVLSDANYWDRCPGTGAVIPKHYTGWWLRAVDRRGGPFIPLLAIYYGSPELVPLAPLGGAATALTPPIRIAPAAGPPRRTCGTGKRLTREQLRGLLRLNAKRERERRRHADAGASEARP